MKGCPICIGEKGKLGGNVFAKCCKRHDRFNRIRKAGRIRSGPVVHTVDTAQYAFMIFQAQRRAFEEHAINEAYRKAGVQR